MGVTMRKGCSYYGGGFIGVIGTTDPGDVDIAKFRDGGHATAHGWEGGRWEGGGNVWLAGKRSGGWPSGGWKRGETVALMLDTAGTTLTLKHRRLSRAFAIDLPGGVAEWFVNVYGTSSVEVQRMSVAEYDAFLPCPRTLRNGGCFGVTFHAASTNHMEEWHKYCYGAIGVIGTPDSMSKCHSANHATAYGWHGDGNVWLAGNRNHGHGGWPSGGWKRGETVALMLDTAGTSLTLKHRRLGRTFVISLPSGVAEWFVNVVPSDLGSFEVQPMSTADYASF